MQEHDGRISFVHYLSSPAGITPDKTPRPSVSGLGISACPGSTCKAHQGALTAYLEAKEATNDWEIVKERLGVRLNL